MFAISRHQDTSYTTVFNSEFQFGIINISWLFKPLIRASRKLLESLESAARIRVTKVQQDIYLAIADIQRTRDWINDLSLPQPSQFTLKYTLVLISHFGRTFTGVLMI